MCGAVTLTPDPRVRGKPAGRPGTAFQGPPGTALSGIAGGLAEAVCRTLDMFYVTGFNSM